MNKEMVKKIFGFCQSRVEVEAHGDPKESENSRKGLLKVLLAGVLVAGLGAGLSNDVSASGFDSYKSQQMTGFDGYKANGGKSNALSDLDKQVDILKTEERERAVEAKNQRASTTPTPKVCESISGMGYSDVEAMAHRLTQNRGYSPSDKDYPTKHNEYSEELTAAIDTCDSQRASTTPQAQPESSAQPESRSNVTYVNTDVTIENGEVTSFKYNGPPPSEAACKMVEKLSFSDVAAMAHKITINKGYSPSNYGPYTMERLKNSNNLTTLIGACMDKNADTNNEVTKNSPSFSGPSA